jgi:Flp pilus assembly pilin Flp
MTRRRFGRTLRNERGATAVEYSVIVFLIAAVIIVAVASLGGATSSNLDCTGKSWQNKTAGCATSSGSSSTPTPTASPTTTPGGNGNGGVGNGNGNGNSKH